MFLRIFTFLTSMYLGYVLLDSNKVYSIEWQQISETSEFKPRDSAGEFYFQGYHYLIGGYHHNGNLRDIWRTDDFKDWQKIGESPCEEIAHPIFFAFKGEVFFSCYNNYIYKTRDFRNFELVTKSPPFKGYDGNCVAQSESQVFVFGGLNSSQKNKLFVTRDGKNWDHIEIQGPSYRQCHSGFHYIKGDLFLIGGRDGKNPSLGLNDLWVLQSGGLFKKLRNLPWLPQFWDSIISWGDVLIKAGGYRFENGYHYNLHDVYFSKNGITWSKIESENIWSKRHELSLYMSETYQLFVVGGNSYPVKNDVWELDLKEIFKR